MENIFGNGSNSHVFVWRPEPLERGSFSILSTCIVTLGLCVWTAIHLNVPERGPTARRDQFLRKVGWLLFGFLAPELVAYTAFYQYFLARKITKAVHEAFPAAACTVGVTRSPKKPPGNDDDQGVIGSQPQRGFMARFRRRRPVNTDSANPEAAVARPEAEGSDLRASGEDPTGPLPAETKAPAREQGSHPTGADDIEAIRDEPDTANNNSPESANVEANSAQIAEQPTQPWTMVHSHFVAMGGFEFRDPRIFELLPRKYQTGEKRDSILVTVEGFLLLLRQLPHLIPLTISRARIEDKSKASSFAKTLICIQATWFGIQCVVRLSQHMGISLLELNVLGHVLCTLATYVVWWEKPLDIQQPEEIVIPASHETRDIEILTAMSAFSKLDRAKPESSYLYAGAFRVPVVTSERSSRGYMRGIDRRVDRDASLNIGELCVRKSVNQAIPSVLYSVALGSRSNTVTHDRNLRAGFSYDTAKSHFSKPIELGAYRPVIRRWRLALKYHNEVGGVHSSLLTDRIRNLPRFEAGPSAASLYTGFAAAGLVYGGLHCMAWNAPFPTSAEQQLWRLSSVTVASTGIILLPVSLWNSSPPFWRGWTNAIESLPDWLLSNFDIMAEGGDDLLTAGFKDLILFPTAVFLKVCFDIAVTGALGLYVLARAYLVVECFLNLLHLPDSAFSVPQWSRYIPHIA